MLPEGKRVEAKSNKYSSGTRGREGVGFVSEGEEFGGMIGGEKHRELPAGQDH